MRYVVKLGGAGLETPELLSGCVRAIAELVRDGNQVAVVHGGGVQLDAHAEGAGQAERVHRRAARHRCRDARRCADGAGRQGEQEPGRRAGCAGPARGGTLRRRRLAVSRPQEADQSRISALSARSRPAIRAGSKPSGSSTACRCFRRWRWVSMASTTTSMPTRWPRPAPLPAAPMRSSFLPMCPACAEPTAQYCAGSPSIRSPRWPRAQSSPAACCPSSSACREALLNGVKRVRILPAEAAGSLPDLCSSRVAHGTEVMVA